ncbi:hypothetical protein K501DRAFT_285956 [Backusella circina FSU 941]|nr:hypothetical protein K501DRAFT_285956 [Backusella circina FSU 941]
MFKSRKKRLQQQQQQQQQQHHVHVIKKSELEEYKLLDDLKSANDFRSSVILPQLGKDMTTASQEHLASSPLSMPSVDGSKQYQDLAAWRHERSQHRYSNGLFGGKQRDRPKITSYKQTIEEDEEDNYHYEQEIVREDIADERHPDAILEEEEYEPDSDMEENYFFKDFSANSQPKQPKQKSRQKKPTGGLFDLSSFARDLHDHRLSVVQPRESRIIMTEEDEQELEKLLTLQRKRMSMMTIASDTSSIKDEEMPPLPSLENINSYKPQQQKQQVNLQQREYKEQEAEIQEKSKEITTHEKEDTHNEDAIKSYPIEPVEINKDVSHSTATSSPLTPPSPSPKSPRVLKPATSISTSSIQPVTSISTSSIHYPVKELEPVKRSASTASIRSQQNKPKATTKLSLIPEITAQRKKTKKNAAFRKSMSMDDISSKLEIEPSYTSAALEWIDDNNNVYNNNNNKDYKKDSAGTNFTNYHHHQQTIEKHPSSLTSMPLPPTPSASSQPKSLGLFGSLRQVSRSKTHSGHKTPSIKGLVRNLSSSHYHHSRRNQHDNNSSDQDQQRKSDQGMSRAAMAVIQHNVAKHEKDKITPIIPSTNKKKRNSDENNQPSSVENASRTSGAGILSQLLARASKQRRNTTKTTNMEDEKAKDARKRAQVVRRTIIYVQPNSLHDLLKKNGGDINKSAVPPPPVPALYKSNTTTPEGSLSADDETVQSQEYVTATKVVRQASVRKRIVENTETLPTEQPTVTREGSRKRWQLKSMEENEVNEARNHDSDYMEGVELREMSDGSVVWGIVKKQGNRKSFYSPQNNLQEEVEEEDEEEEEKQQELKQLTEGNKKTSKHLRPATSSPPPIPKRSPRRQAEKHSSTSSNDQPSTTDIYYSDISLPNLLQMMKKQQQEIKNIIGESEEEEEEEEETKFNERAMASVDEQLDEMMRSLTSQS